MDDNQQLGTDPSPVLDQVQGDAGVEDMPDVHADSPAADGEKREDLLKVIDDVISKRDPAPAKEAETAAASPAEGGNSENEDEGADDEDDEDYSKVPFNKHPRFQKLLRRVKESEADAAAHRKVTAFIESHGLDPAEAALGIQVMAFRRTDPKAALERLKPIVHELLVQTGEILPADLQQKVKTGELDRNVAAEISRLRATSSLSQGSAEREREAREAEAARAAAASLEVTATEWEADRKAKDPNYATKQPRIMREITFLQRTEGPARTPQEVRSMLKRAYEAVNAEFAPPKPPAPKAVLTGGSAASSNAAPASPPSTVDLIRAKLQQRA